ncbi:MAG: hypothetical protein R3E31_11360 [Chloroflexota bacterium]
MDMTQEWQRRFESLAAAIDETKAMAKEVATRRRRELSMLFLAEQLSDELGQLDLYMLVHEMMQTKTCADLLGALEDFIGEAFPFFWEGYYGEHAALPTSPDFPPRYVMQMILKQPATDLSLVQQAIQQRRRIDGSLSTVQGRALLLADRLAEMALWPAIQAGYLPPATSALCYLDNRVQARLVPYFEVVLVGIAFASMLDGDKPTRDFLAIPHEIGHHLFWNGRIPNTATPLHQALLVTAVEAGLSEDSWQVRWLEEIFCDTYALLVGGPAVALDFQDMLDDDTPAHFCEDTDKHPIPEIRPRIQTEILRRITDQDGLPLYCSVPDQLDANWEAWIARNELADYFQISGVAKEMSGQEILEGLEPILAVVLESLQALRPLPGSSNAWSGELPEGADVTALYAQFQQLANPGEGDVLVNIMLDWFKSRLTGQEPGLETAVYFQRLQQREKSFAAHLEAVPNLFTGDWVQNFLFQGWSDEGPLGGSGSTRTLPSGGWEVPDPITLTDSYGNPIANMPLTGSWNPASTQQKNNFTATTNSSGQFNANGVFSSTVNCSTLTVVYNENQQSATFYKPGASSCP